MPVTTVVGIAEDSAQGSRVDERRYHYYLPIDQFRPAAGFAVVLRMRDDPALAAERVRRALQAVMPGETYVTARPLSDLVDNERRSWQVGATMFVAFGGLALVVAAVGLYGVIAYNVAQRMQGLAAAWRSARMPGTIARLVWGRGPVRGDRVTLGTLVALLRPDGAPLRTSSPRGHPGSVSWAGAHCGRRAR